MAQAIVAAITDTGRAKLAEMLAVGRAFTITDFVSGSGGHDISDPSIALTPDVSATTLPSQSFGPKAVTSKSLISPYCVEYICDLDYTDAVGELSNFGLIATFTFSPIPADPLLGTQFLFCIANTPLSVKTDSEVKSVRMSIQY
jgi:hypothetical protein